MFIKFLKMANSENSNSFENSQILDIDDKFDDDEEQINTPQKEQKIIILNL